VAYVNRSPGGQVILYTCVAGAPDETWNVRPVGTAGPVTVYDGALCLAEASGTGAAGARLTTASCTGAAGQQWTLTGAGQLQHAASGKCAMPAGGATWNMTEVVLAPCDGAAAQRWSAPSLAGVGIAAARR
jgi:hypothetical protein